MPTAPLRVLGSMGIILALAGCTTKDEVVVEATKVPSANGNELEYENAVAIASCLTDRGWDVEVDPQGGWGVVAGTPPEQTSLYQADFIECTDSLGLGDPTVTEESASYTFQNNSRVTACLGEAGYSVPEIPDQRAFILKTLENPDADIWDPYLMVPKNQIGSAVTSCPQ